jgi:hypothetical protein
MTTTSLATALRACSAGLYPLEAGVGLLIANGTFLAATTSPAALSSTAPPARQQSTGTPPPPR